jgi:imidazolonepropionase-like amidohydrolase
MVGLWLALSAPAMAAPTLIAYTHGRWWTGQGFASGVRYVQNGVFVEPQWRHADRTVDLHGAWVTPPFADAHNHMAGPAAQVSDTATRAGIFYLMNPTILASAAPSVRAALKGPGKVDAVLSMGAITAPGGHPEPLYVDVLRPRVYPNIAADKFLGDAFHYVTKLSDIGPVLDRLQAQGAEFVKIMVLNSEEYARRKDDPASRGFRGLDPALVAPLVAEAHRRDLRVAAHIETAADFRVIVAAGVDEAAHMPGYYGAKGDLGRYAITEEDAAAASRSHMVVVATASLAADNNQGHPERLAEVQAMQRANLEKLKSVGVPLLIGTDGGPGDSLKETRYLLDLGVLTPTQALKTLTETTPRWIFPGRRIGRLAPGYEASFLVLGGDPTMSFDQAANILRRVKQGAEIVPGPLSPTLAITHVNVVPMDRPIVLMDCTILIAGDRIVGIGHGLKPPRSARVIDARGRYALPGLWDMHVHVLGPSDLAATGAMLQTLLDGGVTGVRDMGSTVDQLQRIKAARWGGAGPWPDFVGAGPVVNGPATPWSRPNEAHVRNPEEGRRVVQFQIAQGSDFIKTYSGLDPASYAAVVEAAHAAGFVAAGHLPMSISLQTALDAGQRSVEHMEVHFSKSCGGVAPAEAANQWISGYANGLAEREKIELALRVKRSPQRCKALLQRMARAQVWWTPTLVLDFSDASFIDDEFVRIAGSEGVKACRSGSATIEKGPPALRQRALKDELSDVAAAHRAGIKILAGTDMPAPCAAPLASLHKELELFTHAGMSPFAALRTATVEPARYLGRNDAGTLKAGNAADIVLLDRNPLNGLEALERIAGVVLHGVVVRGGNRVKIATPPT